jgi:hypothetical protein
MKGNCTTDFTAADEALATKWNLTPAAARNYRVDNDLVWHHVEDLETMQLVPQALNSKVPHVGGAALARNGGAD